MAAINSIILISLAIGVICTYLLSLHDRKPFMKRDIYKTLSIISFIFNVTGSLLCIFMLTIWNH